MSTPEHFPPKKPLTPTQETIEEVKKEIGTLGNDYDPPMQ